MGIYNVKRALGAGPMCLTRRVQLQAIKYNVGAERHSEDACLLQRSLGNARRTVEVLARLLTSTPLISCGRRAAHSDWIGTDLPGRTVP